MHINLLEYLRAKILQKLHGFSKRLLFPKVIRKYLYEIHFDYINHLLKPYFDKCKSDLVNTEGHYNSHIIWMFWWQGITNMPPLVKKCILSVKRHSKYNVILITKFNINKYIEIPDIIYEKICSKELDLTHFSDILRFSLLAKYGGLWVDSTIYCTSNIGSQYFDYIYTSGGYHHTLPEFVKGRWSEFLIGGNKNNSAIVFVAKFLRLYFKLNNYVVNYFLADYAINYAYLHNLGGFTNYVDNKAISNNPDLFKMVGLLNKPFNDNIYKIITKHTNMFKLTYKMSFHSGNTFYNKFLTH